MTVILLLAYAGYKVLALASNSDYKIQMHDQKYFYPEKEAIDSVKDNFIIAAAVTSYDGNPEDITDPEIGELVFYRKEWGPNVKFDFIPLESIPCSEADYFSSKGYTKKVFSDILPVLREQYDIYSQKLKCIKNLDDMMVKGNYDTNEAANLMVVFEECDPAKRKAKGLKCKPKADIDKWLEFKYFYVLENEKQFVQYKFEEERLNQSSKTTWYPISSKTRIDYVRMITRKDMKLNDDWFANIGDVFVEEEIGFLAERNPSRELPYQNLFRNSITYELSLN